MLSKEKRAQQNNKSIQQMIDSPFHDSVVAVIWCRMLITFDSWVTAPKFIPSLQPQKERKEKRKENALDILAFHASANTYGGLSLSHSLQCRLSRQKAGCGWCSAPGHATKTLLISPRESGAPSGKPEDTLAQAMILRWHTQQSGQLAVYPGNLVFSDVAQM